MVSEDSVVVAARGKIAAGFGPAVEILCLKTGQHFALDGVGGKIWDWIQTPRKVRRIEEMILREHEGLDPSRCREDLLEFLRALISAGLADLLPEDSRPVP